VAGFFAYAVYVLVQNAEYEGHYIAAIFIGVALSAILFRLFDVYAEGCILSRRLPIQRLLTAWAVAFAVMLGFAFALKISDSFSRIWVVSWFFAGAGTLVGARLVLSEWVSSGAGASALADRWVILGAGEDGQRFAGQINQINDPCTKLLGFIDDRNTRVPGVNNGYEVLGDTECLMDMIRADMVDQVFVAIPWAAGDRLTQIVERLALTPVRVCLVADPLGAKFQNRTIRYVGEVPTLQLSDRPLVGWPYVTKAVEDRLIAALGLLFIAPLMALIALAVKIDSPGPVFFRQKRFGFNNKIIEVWKFRTMYADESDPGGAVQATRNDSRVTRLGHFLRKSSLDELPQLINVLLGDMSVVGPRPHPIGLRSDGRPFEEIVNRYAARHRVKPGITGWAQVNGWRGQTDTLEKLQKRVECDLYYIDNWSIWFDLVIIFKTVLVVFKDENAY
jgi:Undecaprenyl-phosphate glucose phosphotransferase